MKNNSLVNSTLANFQIKHLLGRGGMAEVYYGWDINLHRAVAIKVFETSNHPKSSQTNRFIQEARMMAKWRHDNIVPIYYAGDDGEIFYYVMEFIDGYDLASIMTVYAEKGELMPTADILRIGESIASALDYAHAQGVIHRDVKPANVMIASDGRVVLGDFGLALNIKDKSHGEVFGSPHYISPEQARRSSDAVPQSDLYSLGVILYEMLTGATPFNDPSPASLALQHITEPPPLPRSINPGLSTSVEDVLLKILEKKPTDRYQTGQSLMAAVSKAVADKPVATPTDAPPLPPIPVNAPTIQRSNIPLSSFTKQRDVITALQKHSTTTQRAAVDNLPVLQPRPKRKLTGLIFIIPLFLSVLVLGWKFRPDLFSFLYPAPPTATATVAVAVISNTEPAATIKIPATDTLLPKPTITQIIPTMPMLLATATQTQAVTQTATATLTVTPTQTQTVVAKSKTPTITATIAQSVLPTSTIAYPNGYLMTAFYNENSFYILNKGKASRSVSGFMFERILADGTFGNQFAGWEWEKYFGILYQNRCISLEIDKSPLAYLNPPECENRVLSNLKPAFDSATLFWTPNDNSKEFRILWLSEEIARCTIETGVCDFRVP